MGFSLCHKREDTTFAYGYIRRDLRCFGPNTSIRRGFSVIKRVCLPCRDIPRVSLGVHVCGQTAPSPSPTDYSTLLGGVCKRVGCTTPPIDKRLMHRFRSFVRAWLRWNVNPLPANTDYGVAPWLGRTSYPNWRRKQLESAWSKCGGSLRVRHLYTKSFVKRESYWNMENSYKEARTINSRSDAFKVFSGPYFSRIEEVLYKRHEFIKHVSVDKRASYVVDLLRVDGRRYFGTDYTSFEACFSRELINACEMQLYSYMLRDCPDRDAVVGTLRRALAGTNVLHFQSMRVSVGATRMSGDMCTSLGNGFTNLMLMKFWAYCNGDHVDGVVEGDDGLFATASGAVPHPSFFEKLGMRLKLETFDSLSTAGFCSMIFSERSKRVLVDPMKKIVNLGWTFSPLRFSPKKRVELLRAKALSMLCAHPACPIVESCARWVLRIVGKGSLSFSGIGGTKDWFEEQIDYTNYSEDRLAVSFEDRLLVAEKYGVPVSHQLAVESYFDTCHVLCPIPSWVVRDFVPSSCSTYNASHVFTCSGNVSRWKM